MRIKLVIMLLVTMTLACEENEGFYITESCREYESIIRKTVADFNETAGEELAVIEGFSDSVSKNNQIDANDGTDYYYCIAGEGRGGTTNIGWGDIYLYTDDLTDELMYCLLMHEFGHRYLMLRHSDRIDAWMYPGFVPNCADRTVWE